MTILLYEGTGTNLMNNQWRRYGWSDEVGENLMNNQWRRYGWSDEVGENLMNNQMITIDSYFVEIRNPPILKSSFFFLIFCESHHYLVGFL
jgi:hypothetical protein